MKRITTKILAAFCLIFGVIFANMSIISPTLYTSPTYAVGEDDPENTPTNRTDLDGINGTETEAPDDDDTPDGERPPLTEPTDEYDPDAPLIDNIDEVQPEDESSTNTCSDQAGSLSWIVCPATEFLGNIIDGVYNIITNLLVVKPISTDTTSPIYIIWQYTRSITNILFIIFLIIVIISQVTGLGINNYGIKRALPRLVIAVVLVNLSYLICSIAVDASNIIGSSLTSFLNNIQTDILAATEGTSEMANISIAAIVTAILSGISITGLAIGFIGGSGYGFFMILFFALGGIIAIASGFITLAARQALVALLIMIAPLAFVAYLLPNTEKWFTQWKNLFIKMLIFYPMFSLLFGASKLVGWTLIITATEPFTVILGLAVQVFPLFFSWSLMKMSGTILNAVNTGVRKALSPVQKSLGGWALEHAEHQRQTHFAKDAPASSRLRKYLDARRELRASETKNALEIRHDRAVTQAMLKSSSITGRDENGLTTWDVNPNHYTRTAKSANFHHSAATAAASTYQNTLSKYGDLFLSRGDQALNDQAGDAFVDSAVRQLEAKNLAEADQKWLLGQFLTATNNKERNPYEFNRLIGDAAGGLGVLGESSIMGQVIVENSNIENRRRTEARIMITKFGYSKTQFRNMNLDKAHTNDDGYETDANGKVIEDEMGNIIEGQHEQYPYYIGVHKKTNQTISKEEYDNLSSTDRANYNRVKYMYMYNDAKDPVQIVYETDTGYMKEMLSDDVMIGDPINQIYASELGVAHTYNERNGILRAYHSTMSKALETYKDHDATFTPMVTSQLDHGYITSRPQLNIARLQSLAVAVKSGRFLQTDGVIIKGLTKLIQSFEDDEKFSYYFPDAEVDSYRNVNGIHLDGWRLAVDENGQEYWKEINHNNPNITVEDKKNFLKHKLFAKDANKIIGMLNKNITQAVNDNMKPDGLKALIGLRDAIIHLAEDYDGENLDFEKRFTIDGDLPGKAKSILESPDPNVLKGGIRTAQQDHGINPYTGLRDPNINPYRRGSIDQLEQRELRRQEAELNRIRRNSYSTIHESISGFFDYINSYDDLAFELDSYINATECLSEHSTDFARMIEKYRFDDRPSSRDEIIHDMTHREDLERERIEQLRSEFEDYLDTRIDYEG